MQNPEQEFIHGDYWVAYINGCWQVFDEDDQLLFSHESKIAVEDWLDRKDNSS